jgi:3',5'-cyclic AMP phosphodiesterase CpdA
MTTMDTPTTTRRPVRAWTFSDLHQEWPENRFDPLADAPEAFDLVLVAGDVSTPLTASLAWLHERFAGVPLAFVPGNHEFYWDGGERRYTIWEQIAEGRELADRLGIHLLMNDTVTVAGLRLFGATLWTNLALGSHSYGHARGTAEGYGGMKDYRKIRTGPRSKNRLDTADTLGFHRTSRRALRESFAEASDLPRVVMSHHAPHPASLADPFMDLRWCYASDLSDDIGELRPALWIHGHLHGQADYRVADTRIVMNARGHIEEAASRAFQPGLILEI